MKKKEMRHNPTNAAVHAATQRAIAENTGRYQVRRQIAGNADSWSEVVDTQANHPYHEIMCTAPERTAALIAKVLCAFSAK